MTATEETDVERRPGGGRERLPLSVAAFALLALAGAVLLVWLATRAKFDDETRRRMLTDLAAWDAAAPEQRRLAARWVAAREPAFALSRLERFTCGGQSHEVAIYSQAATGLEFSLVPGGTFVMGSSVGEARRKDDETQHAVTLRRPFFLARTECTQRAWDRLSGDGSRRRSGADLPMSQVNCTAADAWCREADLVLPTEAQWEYACRASTAAAWSSGDERELPRYAWFLGNRARGPQPVASLLPNAFGLFDMHGNVGEWCAAPAVATDRGLRFGRAQPNVWRFIRGGDWNSASQSLRSACRGVTTDFQDPDIGFRPAKDVALE